MASAADALAAANAATAVITATDASIDAIEIGQTAIATQLAQFLALVQGGGAGGGGAGGGGGGPLLPPLPPQRRRLDPSGVDKLHSDISISPLKSWRNRWNDFVELSQLAGYPITEQMAAFRMTLDPPCSKLSKLD
jgi:hypothetical protein